MDIYCDDREDADFIALGMTFFPEMEVKRLSVGDVICGNLCIEHKKDKDFAASIIDGRLKRQAIAMKQNYANPFIFIVGNWKRLQRYKHYKWFKEPQYSGMVASLSAGIGVPVITCVDDSHYWYMVGKFIEKSDPDRVITDEHIVRVKGSNVPLSMLMCIPRLGKERAKAILDMYSFEKIPYLKPEDLMKIPGIGEKRANNIINAFKE